MESAQNGGSDQRKKEDYRYFSEICLSSNKQTIGSSQRGILENSGGLEGIEKKPKRSIFKYCIKPPRRPGLRKRGASILLISPSATFQRIANERDGISRSTPTPRPVEPIHGLRDGVKVPFVGEIRWVFLKEAVKAHLKSKYIHEFQLP